MAEDKNGFLLYKDLIHSVRKLPKEKAGELFMHILSYVNDENPETEDFIIELAFEPVKQHLKRDLKKYKTKLDKKSESGRIGNLKKWHPEIYEKYESGLLSLEEAEKIAKDRKVSQCDNFIANVADNDNDTVNDNVSVTVIDNDILLGKETKEEKFKKENSEELFSDELDPVKLSEDEKRKKVAQKKEKAEPPDLDTFVMSAMEIYQNELKLDFSLYEFAVRAKYNSWIESGWKDGHKKPIISWKSKLRNVIPHLKPIYGKSNNQTGATGNNTPAQQATYNIQEAAGRLAKDFAEGNIPGVYR
ncbi:DUF6291 domain-containing protein [uncultured Chryseobacterium sp.]|uniref:DUF6291 domain-containing protein n=1 Tax=uncultured Chryseobacterium sp. TaxID=259322 RepID=UPI00258CB690|nr:DUF6291 domain-containing protein [uncultured Chryseobacterium sp.]